MEFQQKKLETEKTTQNIYRLFSMKTMKSKDEVRKKQRVQTMKNTMKKFHLVSKYANYLTWDEKQNAPSKVSCS